MSIQAGPHVLMNTVRWPVSRRISPGALVTAYCAEWDRGMLSNSTSYLMTRGLGEFPNHNTERGAELKARTLTPSTLGCT